MTRTLGALAAVLLLAAGCAGTTPHVADPARKSVTMVSVGRTVTKPPEMFYLGPGNVGLLFGAIGGAASAPGIADERKAFQSHVEKHGISIEAIARDELDQAIRKSGKLAVADQPVAGGATMVVSVLQYGFGVPNLFSSNVVPVVYLKCELIDAAGKVLWSARDRDAEARQPCRAGAGAKRCATTRG